MSRFVVLRALILFCLVAATHAHAQESANKTKALLYGEMNWQKDKTLPSVQSVPLWGNPLSGEHGMLRKFPAGYAPPMHKHPSVERVVVISGTIAVLYGGSGEKLLGPGSYSEVPPNTDHAVKCGPQSECVFLLTSTGPFAIVPSTARSKPNPRK